MCLSLSSDIQLTELCVNLVDNSRGCDKKKEAMTSGGAAAGSGSQHQGATTTTEGMGVDDLDEDAAREQKMYWEETLEAADAEASGSDSPSVNVDDLNCVNPSEEPMAVKPPPSNSSTAYVPPRPIINPTMSKRPIRRRNVKRPPPSQPSSLRPVPPQPTPITPTTPQLSVVRPTSPTNQLPPRVTGQTMHGASRGTTTRFMRFMPTPPSTIQTPGRWPVPGFHPPTRASSSGNNNGVSSGSSNFTPNKYDFPV
ncbi:leucine-rich repeat extensin-like protein 5 [Arachis duranensis]|uniref:Leucine-rich repeat extensin-like protein 5 n=1 Tax=Arachis duranensis TaxID=130453 RepID=A0A9C6TH79_ARADU|nr:leucine-rich repeat extensin-like protein 5 [Arachis duranensis]